MKYKTTFQDEYLINSNLLGVETMNELKAAFVSENVDEIKIKEFFDYIESNHIVVKPKKVFKLSTQLFRRYTQLR